MMPSTPTDPRAARARVPIRAPRPEPRLRRWCFERGMQPASGRPDRGFGGRAAWLAFQSLLITQNPRVRGRRFRALIRFWRCQIKRAGGHHYAIEADGARFLCPPWSALGAVTAAAGSHEPDETAFVAQIVAPGDGVIDAGANIGWFSLPLAVRGAHVLAFEPVEAAACRLEENALRSQVAQRVMVVREALSDRRGTATFTTDRDAQNLILDLADAKTYAAAVEVPMTSLDAFAEEHPHWFTSHGLGLLKIDVEGEDERVLRGALGLVRRYRPVIMIETRGGGATVRSLLHGLGYRACWYDMSERCLYEIPAGWKGNFQFHTNVLALPEERLGGIAAAVGG